MTSLDLRGAADRADLRLGAGALAGLDEFDRQSAILTWRGRMLNEHVSARVFSTLARQLERAGVRGDRPARVGAMVAEEWRHADRCAAVVEVLGGDPVVALPALPPVPEHEDADAIEAVLRNVISVSCLSETVAVALIDAERRAAGPPALQRLLAEILADEVGHARFGWRLVEEYAPSLSPTLRERLGDYLVIALDDLATHELSHLPARPSPSSAAEAVGVCDGHAARRLFFATVNEVIVPGLEASGLPALSAWRAAQELGAWASAQKVDPRARMTA
ncbi:ferritin-like domain-containing protein [Nannocystis bainbridge]|uniref:Ferritin-like domain-containing protein n=1 Tax=Nannocystis bainbridge TaxID=2995303 RepID=A0ABT5DZT4_9BACT|nr:ferritin-like domain-containing protein [Nannocystis bainbridge]MDC0719129.1 ferritin-like domain-containing protein [Nannocystis bainbridge]